MGIKRKSSETYIYGKHQNPTSWFETAEIISKNQHKAKKSGSTTHLKATQKLLKASK